VPVISLTNPPANPSLTINYFASGVARPYPPLLTSAETFGSYNGESGGNGLNHDSSQAENAVDWAVLEACRFGP
jgi:hypothetical protein